MRRRTKINVLSIKLLKDVFFQYSKVTNLVLSQDLCCRQISDWYMAKGKELIILDPEDKLESEHVRLVIVENE